MDVRLLGAFEVWEGAERLPVGRGLRAHLLLALALAHGRVVPADRLVELLWPGEPPESAANMVQVYVGRLRRVLGSDVNGVLASRPPGYVLEVAPEALDSVRFGRLAAAGQTALATDPVAAATRLREALALWRGEALDDLPAVPLVIAERQRLAERRLLVFEDLFDAELALGRHGTVAAEAEALVALHPLRERLRGQLMLALYRSGRQADALRTYAELREQLSETLGIDPDPALSLLERSILRHDAVLSGPLAAGTGRGGRALVRMSSGASLLIGTAGGRQVVPLVGDRFAVGRGLENDLVLEGDPMVSRRHALLERTGSTWTARDLESRNGTLLNDVRLDGAARQLLPHDRITIGGAELTFLVSGGDDETL